MSHPPPGRKPDPEGDKRRALKLAASASARVEVAEATRDNAVRFAADVGASYRELADVTGLSHMTVKRIIDRART